jgi:UDP-N-acetylglucosamine 4,6-dehydratase/5-epimerase
LIKINKKIENEYKNKTVLITGGTGSIGLGIVKKLIHLKPKMIKILTNDENSIFESRKILGEIPQIKYVVGDVRDNERLRLAMRNVDIVFHAAAMKHIDICEQNPFDAVKTNVIGTSNILEASIIEGVSKFVFISTDKATNPTTTLGASKLLAERLTQDASSYVENNNTIFSIVRFGNVIGSRGSVFQIFYNQLLNNNSITVTDSRMTRFIMSISDAASMILKISVIAQDGETYILKMPSVKIEELAKSMVKVFKKRTNQKNILKIKISKVREYERFYEILVTNDETPFCYDLGDMYKLSKMQSKSKFSDKQFNSETANEIPKKKLEKIINELMDDYLSNQ